MTAGKSTRYEKKKKKEEENDGGEKGNNNELHFGFDWVNSRFCCKLVIFLHLHYAHVEEGSKMCGIFVSRSRITTTTTVSIVESSRAVNFEFVSFFSCRYLVLVQPSHLVFYILFILFCYFVDCVPSGSLFRFHADYFHILFMKILTLMILTILADTRHSRCWWHIWEYCKRKGKEKLSKPSFTGCLSQEQPTKKNSFATTLTIII